MEMKLKLTNQQTIQIKNYMTHRSRMRKDIVLGIWTHDNLLEKPIGAEE
jgi:hypothetical protein